MPNTFTNLLNTVAARLNTEVTAQLQPHAAFLSAITMNPVEPEIKAVNDIVKLNVFAVSQNVTDHITGALTTGEISTTPTSIQLNKVPSKTIDLTSIELSRLPDNPGMLDEALRVVMIDFIRYFNTSIAGLFTVGNFDTAGNSDRSATTGADAVSYAQITNLWTVLTQREIPMTDTGNVFVVTHPVIYGGWLGNEDFTKATSIGDQYASTMRSSGGLMPINGMLPLFDSAAPTTTSGQNLSYTTAAFHRRAVVAQFAYPPTPMGNVEYRYTNVMGIPLLIVTEYDTNTANAGGAKNRMTFSALWDRMVFRKDHCVLDRTPFAAT